MHVDDLADALVFLMERYDEAAPINVGSGKDIGSRPPPVGGGIVRMARRI
ncbi:hypothetical protein [Mesorhizobium mediterraneum]